MKLFALRCVHDMLVSACYVLSVCYFKGLNVAVLYTIIVPYSCINSNLPRKSVCKSSEAVNQFFNLFISAVRVQQLRMYGMFQSNTAAF